jgi:hypothetical protein
MQHPNDKIEAKYNTDAGVSKEDEDRYHSLLAENDDLQKLIAAVSSCSSMKNTTKHTYKILTFSERGKDPDLEDETAGA